VVRRLYSTFAGGWPGLGLLLLRLGGGLTVLERASSGLTSAPPGPTMMPDVLQAGAGLLVIAGLWTPIAGTLVAVQEIWQILTGTGDASVSALVGTIAGAVAMLGPGLWSIDARLFGWKRVDIPPQTRNPELN
jgi:hypothetical protein